MQIALDSCFGNNESKFKIEIKQEISQQRELKFVGKESLLRSTEVNMKE